MLEPSPGERQNQLGPVQPCPYCRLYPLVDGRCQKCGTLCRHCGTPYRGAYCPRCWGEGADDEEWAQGALGPAAPTPFGDSAPSRRELGSIIDHKASVKEHNIARGIHVDALEKAVHDKATAAAEQLDVSQEVRSNVVQAAEREAASLWRRARKNGGKGVSLEKAVALVFLGQCRRIGRSVEETQNALSRSGFRIRLDSVGIRVWSEDHIEPKLYVNGRERGMNVVEYPRVTKVPLYLSDLRYGDGEDGGVVEIRVEDRATIVDTHSPYEVYRPNWQTVKVFAERRCFYLFKARKEATIQDATGNASSSGVNVEALLRRFQPSKFPITATLMDNVGCLRKVEVRFASLLRDMIGDARGRAPDSVAASALYLADMDVFRSLPPPARSLAWSSVVRMGLARGSYVGVKGLVLRSEIGFDESVVQNEDLRWIREVVS